MKTVSIIVPVFNEAERIGRLLAALQKQSYPNYEIVIVDNGSTDETLALVSRFAMPMTRLVFETEVRGPDAARNTGVLAASGEILAFTDADCLPEPRWIEEAVAVLEAKRADLVAGNIVFDLPAQPNAAQIYDAISFLQHSDSVVRRGVAFTSNLLITRQTMETLGGFPVDRGWNGDVLFTRHAVQSGKLLVYAERARVTHPVRSWRGLLLKVWRIAWGKGIEVSRRRRDPFRKKDMRRFLFEPKPHLRHLNPAFLTRALKARFDGVSWATIGTVWILAWGVGCLGAVGVTAGMTRRALEGISNFLGNNHSVQRKPTSQSV